ncbi:TetR/AcrR family transcriptional regulator [Solihabitans fulvus]|uniref:TetR/AcrR family transcriptional regulator n=2 Tax=Solihabitans fulvus TaxID=1892852 RepID=A0A5B2XKG5_9PSEU|nr:TetR/AcrR family transcriptional regulator [Solihabitans fulvus]
MRRQPVQPRGAATVAAILDACAKLLTDHDYDELTTARIAERAGVPIGSFYQYFPDKRSVVHALTLRGMQQYVAEVERLFGTDDVALDWRGAVNQVFGVYLRMLDEVPGFGRVRFSDVIDNRRLDPEADQYVFMAARLGELFAARFCEPGEPSADTVSLAFRMSVEAADALLKLAERVPQERREHVLLAAHGVVMQLLGEVFDAEQRAD